MRRLFVYGTLLDPKLVMRLTGRPAELEPACLDGFRRVRLHGTEFPTLRQSPGTVRGAVLMADPHMFRRLNTYEGPRYRLLRVQPRLVGSGATIEAYAWIAPDASRLPWP